MELILDIAEKSTPALILIFIFLTKQIFDKLKLIDKKVDKTNEKVDVITNTQSKMGKSKIDLYSRFIQDEKYFDKDITSTIDNHKKEFVNLMLDIEHLSLKDVSKAHLEENYKIWKKNFEETVCKCFNKKLKSLFNPLIKKYYKNIKSILFSNTNSWFDRIHRKNLDLIDDCFEELFNNVQKNKK